MKAGRRKLYGAVLFLVGVLVLIFHYKARTEADAVLAASKAAEAGPGIPGAAGAVAVTGPRIAGCPVFPADNIWNTPIDKAPRDKHSDAYIQRMGPAVGLHPNFGSDPNNGIPITIIKWNRPRIPITWYYGDESDPGYYPTPEGALIEAGWTSPIDSDRHIVMIDQDRCLLFEEGGMVKQKDGSWGGGAGIKMDLTSNSLRPPDKTSTDAAGLPILPGLLRYDEIVAGEVKHAIRFTTPKTQKLYVWPARHRASSITDPSYPPMGQRFRLRADFDISGFSKENQVILKGLKKYGMIISDNGGPWFLIGEPDKRWNDDDLAKLKTIKGENFEAVDVSEWQLIPDSARVDPVALRH